MNKTKALRQARSESYIRPQGSGWVLYTWDDQYQAMTGSSELTWYNARALRKEWIAERTQRLMSQNDKIEIFRIDDDTAQDINGKIYRRVRPYSGHTILLAFPRKNRIFEDDYHLYQEQDGHLERVLQTKSNSGKASAARYYPGIGSCAHISVQAEIIDGELRIRTRWTSVDGETFDWQPWIEGDESARKELHRYISPDSCGKTWLPRDIWKGNPAVVEKIFS